MIGKEELVVKELCEVNYRCLNEEGNCIIDIVKDMDIEDELIRKLKDIGVMKLLDLKIDCE